MEKFGFVGLPNAGKSSLYNALTGGSALAAPYAFATTDPNIGVAKVFDDRLEKLAVMSGSKKVVPASVQFADIGGLVEGASKGEGLGNKFLGGIREVDAIVYVLRAFTDDDVPGPTDPLEHLRVLEIELTLADLDALEKSVYKKRKAARVDKSLQPEIDSVERALAFLEEGTPLYRSNLSVADREILAPYFLLTNKPVLALVNIDEDQLDDVETHVKPVRDELGPVATATVDGVEMSTVFGACIQLEAEAAQLDPEDRAEMLDALGLGEGALPRFLSAAYNVLGLRTFLTTGEKESRAWTFRVGALAPECAGRIHTDIQRGFIRAEVIRWDELLKLGSWSKAKDVGKIRAEGKDYVFSDGDVVDFPFQRLGAATDELPQVTGHGRDRATDGWLVKNAKVLASLEVHRTRWAKTKGLLGLESLEGAVMLVNTKSVHTIGMKFDIDVAFLDQNNCVIKIVRMKRWRISAFVPKAKSVIEVEAGAFARWGVQVGDVLEVRE